MRLLAGVLIMLTVLTGCARTDDGDTGGQPEPAPVAPPIATGTAAPTVPRDATPRVARDVPVRSAQGVPAVQQESPPVRVVVPALDADLPVDPVGIAEDGQMEIPPDAARAGWYRFGPSAGAPEGTAVIAAHSGSHITALGPLRNIVDLEPGDTIDVTRADGETARYTVESAELIPKTVIDLDDHFRRDGEHRLVLITCDGVWRDDVQSYTDNTVVTATLIAS